MKYHAFISYNKAADQDLAPAIREGLEKFAKPVFKRKALNIFLDSSALSATPDLWHSIENGLAQAEYFIFLASPGSAKSIWCIKELAFWKQHKDINKLLLIWTSGELYWDNLTGDFDWNKTTALPIELKGAFKNEPLYIDLRGHQPTEQLTLNNTIFRNQIGMLAAPLHEKPLEDLLGEDIAIHKRTIRLRNGAIGVLSILLLASILLSIFALRQKNLAEKQTIEALMQSNRALSRSYLSDSKANLEVNPTLAIRLAEYGYLFAKSHALNLEEFEDQLIKTYYNPSNFYLSPDGLQPRSDSIVTRHTFGNLKFEMDTSAHLLYFVNEDGARTSFPNDYGDYAPDYFTFSPKGKFVITENEVPGANYAGTVRVLKIYQLPLKKVAEVSSGVDYGTKGHLSNQVRFNSAETRFIITGEEPGTSVYDIGPGEVRKLLLHDASRDIQDIAITADGRQVALANQKGVVDIIKVDGVELRIEDQWQLRGHGLQSVDSIQYSADGHFLFTKSTGFKRKWQAAKDVSSRYIQLVDNNYFSGDELPEDQIQSKPGEDSGSVDVNSIKPTVINKPTVGNVGVINIRFVEDSLYMAYINNAGKTVATFKTMDDVEDEGIKSPTKWTSPNGRYYATRNGLFNKRGELLIDYNETRHKYRFEFVTFGFSTDSKFFLLVDKIYFLDANMILSRINKKGKFNSIAPLSPEDKVTYQVSDLR